MFQGKRGRIDFFNAKNKDIYDALIRTETQIPIGFEKWCLDYPINFESIASIFCLAKSCTVDIFTQCFQYKILCQTLPTQEYLFRYRVPDVINNHCIMCNFERCTIEHCLIDCEKIQAFLDLARNWLVREIEGGFHLNREHMIFGIYNNLVRNKGLNHFLLELKKFLFYTVRGDWESPADLLFSRFLSKIKFLIIKEKYISKLRGKYEAFTEKWEQFTPIYDFRGPDNLNVFFP